MAMLAMLDPISEEARIFVEPGDHKSLILKLEAEE